MIKYIQYNNTVPIIPQLTIIKQLDESQIPPQIVLILAEQDLVQPPQFLVKHFQNQQLLDDLKQKKSVIIYGQKEDAIKKSFVYLIKKNDCQKVLFKSGEDHVSKLTSWNLESANIWFSSSFQTNVISEYIYGFFIRNYKIEQKTYPQDQESLQDNMFHPIKEITLFSSELNENDQYFNYLRSLPKYFLMCKSIANIRANIASTDYMFNEAKKISQQFQDKVKFQFIKGTELEEKGLNLIYAVGKGSASPPYLVNLYYEGNQDVANKIVALVGKGVCFDSGGLSLKTNAGMSTMYLDKLGACQAISIFQAAVELQLKVNLVCTIALVENVISQNSYRVSDIITSYKGITVENGNSDAEGRLILADALSWTQQQYKPSVLFDFATLTGACMTALGLELGGVFSNDDQLVEEIIKLSQSAHQPVWRLPITDYNYNLITSNVADINNSAKSTHGGASNAAAFLSKFIEKNTKWVHFDIAGPVDQRYEGYGIRAIVDYLRKE